MEPSYTCEVFCNMYSGSAMFKIGMLQSHYATALQASAINLIEYIDK